MAGDTLHDVIARHRTRIGWPEASPTELAFQAAALGEDLPATSPLLVQAAFCGLTGWPAPGELAEWAAMLARRGALLLPSRPATEGDLEAWPRTMNYLKTAMFPAPGRRGPPERLVDAQRVLAVEIWLRPVPVRLAHDALVLDVAAMKPHMVEVVAGMLTGGWMGLGMPFPLTEVQQAAGCALALRFAAAQRATRAAS